MKYACNGHVKTAGSPLQTLRPAGVAASTAAFGKIDHSIIIQKLERVIVAFTEMASNGCTLI